MRGVLVKEIRLLRASGLLFLVPVLLVAAVFFSLRDGRAWSEVRARTAAGFARRDAEQRAKGVADARKKFDESMANPYVATYYGEVHAALPPGPLAALARGTSDVLPNVETVGAKPDEAGAGAAESRNPAAARVGAFDLAFVVAFLVPLALVALLHDTLAGDRQRGRLALAMAQGASAGRLLAGAVAVRTLLVLAPLLASVALFAPRAPGLGGALMVAGAYVLFWAALGAWVAARSRSAAASAVSLGLLWAGIAVVLPAAASTVARARHPVPAPFAALAVRNETNDRLHENWSTDNELFRALYTQRPDLIPATVTVTPRRIVDRTPLKGRMREMRVETAISYAVLKAVAPLEGAAHRAASAQDRLAVRLSNGLPPAATYDALVALSGNGPKRHVEFVRQVAAFRREWEAFFFARLFRKTAVTAADYGRFPTFVWREPAPPMPWAATGLCLGLAFPFALLAARRLRGLSPLD